MSGKILSVYMQLALVIIIWHRAKKQWGGGSGGGAAGWCVQNNAEMHISTSAQRGVVVVRECPCVCVCVCASI